MAVPRRLSHEADLPRESSEPNCGFVYGILDGALPRGGGVELTALLELTDSVSRCLAVWAEQKGWLTQWQRPSASEAYIELTHEIPRKDLMSRVEGLKSAIRSECGVDMSFGLATTRTIAKLCARMARPSGILLWEPGFEQGLMAAVPLEELDELSEHQVSALRGDGVRTLGRLAALSVARARELLGPSAGRLMAQICPVTPESPGRTLPSWLAELVDNLARQLDKRDAWARGIELEFGYRHGVRDLRYHRLGRPTRRRDRLQESVTRLFRSLPKRKESPVGIRLTGTGIYSHGQLPLVAGIASDVSVYRGRLSDMP